MTAFDWVGVILVLIVLALIGVAARWKFRELLADAWDYGYQTRAYDAVCGLVSANPYAPAEWPVVPDVKLEAARARALAKEAAA